MLFSRKKKILKVKKVDVLSTFIHFYSSSNFISKNNIIVKIECVDKKIFKGKKEQANLQKFIQGKEKKDSRAISLQMSKSLREMPADILRNASSISSESSKQCASLKIHPQGFPPPWSNFHETILSSWIKSNTIYKKKKKE